METLLDLGYFRWRLTVAGLAQQGSKVETLLADTKLGLAQQGSKVETLLAAAKQDRGRAMESNTGTVQFRRSYQREYCVTSLRNLRNIEDSVSLHRRVRTQRAEYMLRRNAFVEFASRATVSGLLQSSR